MGALAEPNHECKGRGFEGWGIVILKLVSIDSKSILLIYFNTIITITLLMSLDGILLD